jgi:hypothetical protein
VFIAQVSQPHAKNEFGGDQAGIKIEVDPSTSDPKPNLGVRFRVKGGAGRELDLTEARKSEPRLKLLGTEDGFADIFVSFRRGAQFEDDEELLVYVHDLNGRPPAKADGSPNPIYLRATLTSESQTVNFTSVGRNAPMPELTPARPAMAVRLADICGQGKVTNVVWRQP